MIRRSLAIPCLLALAASTALAADPAPSPQFTYHDPSILGTSMDLTVVAPTQKDADAAHTLISAEIERLRAILSTRDSASDLAKLNATRDPLKVAPEVLDVLAQYDLWQQQSANAFSGRLGTLAALWKSAEQQNQLPSKDAINQAVKDLQKPLWKLDRASNTAQRLSDAAINIDSLGKGFIVSAAANTARAKLPAVKGILLNIGGDIAALGSSSLTTETPWPVHIADPLHPADNAAPLATIKLHNLAIATSGSYARGTTINGKTYSHLLDPRTGYPVDFTERRSTSVLSATVIAKDAATANALAAAMNVLTPGQGMDLLANAPGSEALLILADGTQMRSKNFSRLENPSPIASGKTWADGYALDLTLQFQLPTSGRAERPYVAVWIETPDGQHVATLAEWGNNQRWMNSLATWWRIARNNNDLLRAVTRATRPAGKYTLTWNGTDHAGNPVPAGTYKVCVEFAYEHNGHSLSSTTITCDGKPATATLPKTTHFAEVPLTYTQKQSQKSAASPQPNAP